MRGDADSVALSTTGLRDCRLLLSVDDTKAENPTGINATTMFVMTVHPYESAATRVTGRGDNEVETYDLPSGANHLTTPHLCIFYGI